MVPIFTEVSNSMNLHDTYIAKRPIYECLSFDDVLIVPQFSEISSRKDVKLDTDLCGLKLRLPIISSNMDTVTGGAMAKAMWENGGIGALHRFCSIQENILQ